MRSATSCMYRALGKSSWPVNGQGRSHLSTYLQETFWGLKVKRLQLSLAESGKVATFAAYKNKKRMQNDYHPEQISSQSECSNAKVGGLLEDASDVARRVLESVQALAGTTYCKRVLFSKYSFFCAILIIVSCIVGFSLADSFWYKVLLGLSISESNICSFSIINNVYAERQMKKWIKEQDIDIPL